MGTYLAIGNSFHIPANFLWAGLESFAIRRGVSTLQIRKLATGMGSYLEAALALCYGLSPNPTVATLVYGCERPPTCPRRVLCRHCDWATSAARFLDPHQYCPDRSALVCAVLDAITGLHGSGGWANYLEVGAEDTAMINATWNTIACMLPIVVSAAAPFPSSSEASKPRRTGALLGLLAASEDWIVAAAAGAGGRVQGSLRHALHPLGVGHLGAGAAGNAEACRDELID